MVVVEYLGGGVEIGGGMVKLEKREGGEEIWEYGGGLGMWDWGLWWWS